MLAATFLCVPLLLGVPDKSPAEPVTSWVGKTVIVVSVGIELGNLNDRNELTPPMTMLMGLDYRVYGERGNFVQLKTREAVSGWLEKKHVVLVDDAVAHFTKLVEQDPTNLDALNHRGWAWALKGEHLAGIKDMTEAIKISPDVTFHNNRARIWGLKGEYDRALADYNIAIELGPDQFLPHFNRGVCWSQKKDYDKAITDFDRALQLNPRFANAHRSRGLSWHAKRDYEQAITDLSKALQLDPKHAYALADRGNAWLAKGEHAKARADLDEAIRLDATSESAFCYRGRLLRSQKEYDKAHADFAEAIRLSPRYALAFHDRGSMWVQQKQFDKAHADFERAWRYDANNADRVSAFAFFLASCPDAKLRDGKRALTLAQQAVEQEKSNVHALQALAAAHAEVANFDEAVRWQKRALEQLKNDADAQRRLELYRKKQPYRQD